MKHMAMLILVLSAGCAVLKEKGPELLKVVCPRCAAAIELLTGTGHTHSEPSGNEQPEN